MTDRGLRGAAFASGVFDCWRRDHGYPDRASGIGGTESGTRFGGSGNTARTPECDADFTGDDGEDGPTRAAGALVTGKTRERALRLGLHPEDFLARHAAHDFFVPLDDLLMTGTTQTNVCDLVFLFAF